MASEEKRSGRNSLNKQRIINPITSTLAADDAVRLSPKTVRHQKPLGKRSNSIGPNPVANTRESPWTSVAQRTGTARITDNKTARRLYLSVPGKAK
ncbi:hypothetical protein MRO89_03230 [Dickeya dianthicola]|uniref:hypothetical protein n=1 Tax=Dickeya dianthicola TaxID=204039 RepID=UPI001F610577|nr:hypothetical protein [Dickeya dianthicola]MCI4184984.1 hypothetical protein [Dickeya dianthicola]